MSLELPALHLCLLERTLSLFRFGKPDEVPLALFALIQGELKLTSFISITRTPDEISIVTDTDVTELGGVPSFWRGIRVKGPLPHSMTGVMNSLTLPLKNAGVPIFAISTWDTDYLLVPVDKITLARNSLEENGWRFD